MRRYNSQDARRRVLAACARLFLEKGYTNTRLTGMVSVLERYINFTQEGSMTQYSVIYDAQHGSATVWLGQDYETSYNLSIQ